VGGGLSGALIRCEAGGAPRGAGADSGATSADAVPIPCTCPAHSRHSRAAVALLYFFLAGAVAGRSTEPGFACSIAYAAYCCVPCAPCGPSGNRNCAVGGAALPYLLWSYSACSRSSIERWMCALCGRRW